jgi:hypothetical protein
MPSPLGVNTFGIIIMENSNMPSKKMVYSHDVYECYKESIFGSRVQSQLKQKRYEPVWAMVHKLKSTRVKREDLYKLRDIIEFDEGHLEVETKKGKRGNLKRGKGSQRQ